MMVARFIKLFLLLGVMVSLQGCFDYEDVEFKGVQNISVLERTDDAVKLKIDVKVDNPNTFNIKVKKSDLDIYINDNFVGKTSLDDKIVLKKETEDVYGVVLSASTKDILKATMGSLGGLLNGNVTVKLTGDVKGSVYGISRKVPVEVVEKINLKDLM